MVTGLVGWAIYDAVPWPVGLAILAVLYLGLVHVLRPNGPGGLRAFAGEPTDDLSPAMADDLDRRNLGTGERSSSTRGADRIGTGRTTSARG